MRPSTATGPFKVYREAFLRSLAAENRSPRTLQTYGEAVELFEPFVPAKGMPSDPTNVTCEHVTEWVNDILDNRKSSTALNRYRTLFRFFENLVEAGEIKDSPMARMKPPKVERSARHSLRPAAWRCRVRSIRTAAEIGEIACIEASASVHLTVMRVQRCGNPPAASSRLYAIHLPSSR